MRTIEIAERLGSPGWGVLSVLLAWSVVTPAAAAPRRLTLAEAVQLAQENNPTLREMHFDVDAAKARVDGASAALRENPSITVLTGPRFNSGQVRPDVGVQISQPIEVGGQRGARIDAAKSLLTATGAQLQTTRALVCARVREAFGRALAAAQRVQLAEETLTIAREGKAAADQRFQAGAAALLEVNTARVELGRSTRERSEAQRRYEQALTELRLLTGLAPSEEISLTGELKDVPATLGPTPELVEQARKARPELVERRAALDAARASAKVAEREVMPSPTLGLSYTRERLGSNRILLGSVSVDLPLFNRNRAARGVASARTGQLETSLANQEQQIERDVLSALSRVRAAQASADGYEGEVVSAMQQNMELVTDSYRAGKIDFLQLVVIRRQAVEARQEYIDVLEELYAAHAELDLALGKTVPAGNAP